MKYLKKDNKGRNNMKYKNNLFWELGSEEVKTNILDKKEEIIEHANNVHTEKLMKMTDVSENDINTANRLTREAYERSWDINNMSNHEPIHKSQYGRKIDLTEYLKSIVHSNVEKNLLIVFDSYSGEVIENIIINEGLEEVDSTGKWQDVAPRELKFIQKYSEKKNVNYGILNIHNHPNSIAAFPSKADLRYFYILKFVYQYAGFNDIDFIILSDCDLYSQKQHDDNEERNENTLFYRDKEASNDNYKFKIMTDVLLFKKR